MNSIPFRCRALIWATGLILAVTCGSSFGQTPLTSDSTQTSDAPSSVASPMTASTTATMKQLIDHCQPRMAKVIGAGAGRIEGYGSGILVSADGLVLASQGVFLDGPQVKIALSDGQIYPATVLRRDRTLQLALLKIEPPGKVAYFKLADGDVGKKGDWIVAISNAFKVASKSEPMSAMIGIISVRTSMEARLNDRDVAYDGPLVLIDAITSNPGANGGAVVTFDGKLVGMIGKLINSSETNTRINYCVPASVLRSFVANDSVNTGAATASLKPKTQPTPEAELGIILFKLGGRDDPAYVDRVRRGSPAARLKLQPDDMILSLAGEKIGSVKEYQKAISHLTPGVAVTMIVKRGQKVMSLQITPAEKKRK